MGCGDELVPKPDKFISEEQMTKIYYDLALLKGLNATNVTALSKNNIEIMPYLFEKYQIDSTQFVNNDLYYASKPEVYQRMLGVVAAQINAQIEQIEIERKRKQDSIEMANEKDNQKTKTTILEPKK